MRFAAPKGALPQPWARPARLPSARWAGRRPPAMALDPSKTAVVVIEFQNDFTTPGGKLHDGVKEVMASTNMLQNTKRAVEGARSRGALVVHAPIEFSDDYRELPEEPYGVLVGVKDAGAFKKGEWGAAIWDELSPGDQDVVIEGKRGLDGFMSTNLDFILRARGIENIALGGFLGNCCVESTMRTAYEKGYKVFTLRDCVASMSEEQNNASINFTYPMFSTPLTHDEFLQQLPTGHD